tara:strand:- start:167 stop:292 length:126 start_codon:yes stop_codon:yes gene_type:complete
MTVGDMLDRMSSEELTEWIALYRIEYSEQEQAQQRAKARTR